MRHKNVGWIYTYNSNTKKKFQISFTLVVQWGNDTYEGVF